MAGNAVRKVYHLLHLLVTILRYVSYSVSVIGGLHLLSPFYGTLFLETFSRHHP
jgi:hypothetical protein